MRQFIATGAARSAAVLAAVLLAATSAPAQDPPSPKIVLDALTSPAGFAKVREALAADALGARVRVDSFTLDKETVKVAGVMLVPGAAEEDFSALEKELRAKVVAVAQEVAGAKGFKEFDLAGVRAVRGEKLPHIQLQQAANGAGKAGPAADELMLADAKFDAKGRLVVTGRRGANPKTKEWLEATAPTALAENYAAVGPDGKPAAVVFALREPDKGLAWPLVPSDVQKRLADLKQPGLARLRVDRAYLAAGPAKLDEANPTGTSWTYVLSGIAIGTQPVAKADVDRITKEVVPAAFTAAKWPAVKSGDLEKLTVADVRVPDPGPKLQAAVATLPALDGVRLDPRAEFGPDGKLVLVGVQPGLDAKGEELLAAKVRGVLTALVAGSDGNPLYARLAERGVSLAKLDRVKVRELHAELKQFAAEKQDETRLARLFYDDGGTLTLTCDSPAAGAGAVAKAELKKRAEKLGVPAALADTVEPVVKASPAALKRSLTAYLQEEITDPKAARWEAVLIERGYFDAENRFTLRGVVNTEKQKTALADLLAALAKEKEWAAYFAVAPAAAPDLEVIPMAKLVERVGRVTPGHPLFDGVRVTGARYEFEKDAKGTAGQTLVFVAHLVGRTDAKAPAALQAMIAEDAKHFGRRLPPGRAIRFDKDPKQPAMNNQLRDFSVGYAADALARNKLDEAKGWLDVGVLYYPTDSAVWYLSAYYHHLRGDAELARRDLYRAVDLENRLDFNGRVARDRRYEAAKGLQGEKRDELEKLWLKCWKDAKEGTQQPLKIAEGK